MERKAVLIIDDEEAFADLMREHLEAITDFDIYTAASGIDGITLAKRLKPDLIILDIVMPGMDGFEVLRKLKDNKETLDIPVMMLSAKSDDMTKIKAAQLFDELYVTKPVDADELKKKIGEVFKWRGEKMS